MKPTLTLFLLGTLAACQTETKNDGPVNVAPIADAGVDFSH